MGSHDYVLSNGLSMMKRSEIKSYETWNAEELAGFISNQGLESYSHTIIEHKITGKLAPLLSEMDLKEMGITCIGDRLRFRLIVDNLKIKKRSLKRTQIVWEGRERIYYSEVTASICKYSYDHLYTLYSPLDLTLHCGQSENRETFKSLC